MREGSPTPIGIGAHPACEPEVQGPKSGARAALDIPGAKGSVALTLAPAEHRPEVRAGFPCPAVCPPASMVQFGATWCNLVQSSATDRNGGEKTTFGFRPSDFGFQVHWPSNRRRGLRLRLGREKDSQPTLKTEEEDQEDYD